MKIGKKVISITLCLIMLIGTVAIGGEWYANIRVFADNTTVSGTCGKKVNWEFDTVSQALTISGSGAMTNFTSKNETPWRDYIIKSVDVLNSVTSIGTFSFCECTELTSVTLPETLTVIGGKAFENCTSLPEISIPDSVTTIGNDAFHSCVKFSKLILPADLTLIGTRAFNNCTGIAHIIIPDGVEEIGYFAFLDCTNLISVSLPESIKKINGSAFKYCFVLSDVYYLGTQEQWEQVSVDQENNNYFLNADIHFSSVYQMDNTHQTGDIIQYGSYPQSQVKDITICSALNSMVSDNDWISYGYYSGSGNWYDGQMEPSDYMKYCDIRYDGQKYRGVTFSKYRPYETGSTSDAENSYQDDNGFTPNNIYWFKYEPLEWRILDPDTGFVMCTTIIDSQAYNNFVISNGTDNNGVPLYYGDTNYWHYANSYADSSITKWLNNVFYETAFSDEQKSNIGSNTINIDYCEFHSSIFLLSYDDVLNTKYGFNPNIASNDPARNLFVSDYSLCQGLRYEKMFASDKEAIWWLRSSGGSSGTACYVSFYGGGGDNNIVTAADQGICPAMRLKELKNDTETIYTLSYNANGGSGEPSSQTGNGNITLSDVIPTKNNYSFLGWASTSYATTAQFQPGASFNLIENITLYAVWEKTDVAKPTCGISSTNDIADHQTALLIMSDMVGLAGYYWGTSSDYSENPFTSISGMNQAVEKTITSNGTYYLTAVDTSGNISNTASKAFHKTAFITNGGTISQENIITMHGYAFIMIAPSKAGYTFIKWTTNEDGSGSSYKEGDCYVAYSSVTLYAQWEPIEYTATFVADDRTIAEIPYTVKTESIEEPQVPDKTGHTGSWEPYTLEIGGITVNAVYSVNTYIAKVKADGVVVAEIPFTYGQKSIDLPELPEKEGYSGSWEGYTLGAENITINAIYKPLKYEVAYIVDGEVWVSGEVTFGESVWSPRNPSKDGYEFKGWDSDIPDTMPANNLTFNAVFEPITYYATFMADGKQVGEKVPFTVDSTYITAPAVPEKEGYFAQWESYTLGTEDITINAVYNVKQYLAMWYVNGKKTTTVFDYGAKIKKPADPVYENHTFVGWSPEVPATMPANDLEFTAVFKLNEASVKIVNYDKYNGQTLPYKSSVTFKADVKNGKNLNWHVEGAKYNVKNGKCTVLNAENDFTVYCTVVDGDGNIAKSKTETIKIKHSFWDRLIGFFIGLFGAFKMYEQ